MKLPRSLGGEELVARLAPYGYTITHQTGSHLRMTAFGKGTENHITVPKHKPLKIGTLESILKDVAAYLNIDKHELVKRLFQHSRSVSENLYGEGTVGDKSRLNTFLRLSAEKTGDTLPLLKNKMGENSNLNFLHPVFRHTPRK
jgi:predicted RNA binding protein YcfA (HicA-like mRNA interferase family)